MEPVTISVLVGAVLPVVVSLLKNVEWSRNWKTLFAVGVSFVAATISALLNGDISGWEEFIANLGVIHASSQVIYQGWFKDSNVDETLTEKKVW